MVCKSLECPVLFFIILGAVISNFMIPLSLDDVRRVVDSEDLIERVVFDLDELITQERSMEARTGGVLSNSDELL